MGKQKKNLKSSQLSLFFGDFLRFALQFWHCQNPKKQKPKLLNYKIREKGGGGGEGLQFVRTVKPEGLKGDGGAQDGTNFFEFLSVASHKSHRLWQHQPTSSCSQQRHFPALFLHRQLITSVSEALWLFWVSTQVKGATEGGQFSFVCNIKRMSRGINRGRRPIAMCMRQDS